MMVKTPTKFFLTAGSSEGYMPLNAFDGALLDAKVGDTNLVRMSSILPPACTEIEPVALPYGSLVPIAYASIIDQMPGEKISAGVAVAIPQNPEEPGLIMEYSARGRKDDIEEMVRRMAEEGFKMRGRKLREIKSIAIEHKVQSTAAAFAAVVLWY
jgi:arginine decarboxylase